MEGAFYLSFFLLISKTLNIKQLLPCSFIDRSLSFLSFDGVQRLLLLKPARLYSKIILAL